jgi:PAS domain S-box-containing protein
VISMLSRGELLAMSLRKGVPWYQLPDRRTVRDIIIGKLTPPQREHGPPRTDPAYCALEALTNISPYAIVGLDRSGMVDLWSPAAASLFGWKQEEVFGKPLPQALGLNAPEADSGPAAKMLGTRSGGRIEMEIRRAFRSDGGTLMMASDLTEATRTEREADLRLKAESRFRELLEAAPDAIIEVNSEGQIVLVNAAAEEIFGYSRDQLVGQQVEMLIPASGRGRHHGHRAGYWANPVTRPMGFGMTLLAQRRDGSEFPVEISLSPVKTDDGFRVTAIIRDVSAKKKAEEDIRLANQQLEAQNSELDRANRLKSEFLASMSHELRTPLHTIIGFTELLNEELEGPLNDKQKRFLKHVYEDSQHLLELINDILDLSKIEAGQLKLHLETFDARTVISDAVNAIRPAAESRGVQTETRLKGPAVINADKTRFREILNNLLSNAVKFTPDAGNVSIERVPAAEGLVAFCVVDTGIGIAPEDHDAIFDKFRQVGSTTRGVREGTGLGLAIVRSFVEMHGGTITVDSTPGEGSRFTFTMPAADAVPPLVLVIEDDAGAQELLASYLEPRGIRTRAAATAEEGIRLARDLKPDAITLDLLLPGKSGWRVLRELRSLPETKHTPVFVVSVLDETPGMATYENTEYLQKPLRKEALLQALHKHAPDRFPMN